nr:Hsp70 family protein [uncultured Marinifilum sp.]
MDKSRLVYGIDLGTTYSCISQVDKFDQAVVIRNFESDSTTPSVVYIGEENNVVVGKEAKSISTEEPDRTVSFIKRHIGVDESYEKPTQFPENLDPSEISAYILKKLVKDANDASDSPEPIKDVVITVPAYFGTKERMQTKQAGEIAGLNVLSLINEPTAAAIAYGLKTDEEKVILVYDLGGGTFDVTIIRVKGGVIKVIATGGNHHLGGVDWDIALSEYMLSVYNQEHGTSYTLESDSKIKNILLLEAEQKKKILTAKPKANANITFNGVSSRIPITRELFDQITAEKLEETIEETKKIKKIAESKGFDTIDEVLLVGGSSKMPQIKECVDRELGCNSKIEDPDLCVAKGAAIYAMNQAYMKAVQEYEEGEIDTPPEKPRQRTNIVNVMSKTYGIGIINDRVNNIVFANTAVPCRITDTLYTTKDNQTSVLIPVFESDFTDEKKEKTIDDKHATCLEKHTLKLTNNWPEGTEMAVVFDIDNEGFLKVHADVKGDSLDFQLKIAGVKSKEELADSQNKVGKANIE